MNRLLSLILLTAIAACGETVDLQGLIDARLASGEKVIIIKQGRYEVAPRDGIHLRFSNLTDVTIEATGVELICTETTQAIAIESCSNLIIRGLTIDYDPLPFTQGRIVKIADDRKSHVIEIMPGFPPAESAITQKHEVLSPEGRLKYGNYYEFELKPLSGNRLEISKLHSRNDGGEQVGDVVVVAARHVSKGRGRPHAVVISRSAGTRLENITLYASPSFGFFEEHCRRSVYRNCTIDRREGRMRSLNADAFHSKFAEIGPQILGCKAMWQGDDCVNICGAYHLVAESVGDALRVLAKRSLDIQPGDPVELVDADGRRLPDAKVLSVKPEGNVSIKDSSGLKPLKLHPRTQALLKNAYVIQLDRPVELPYGSVISAINRAGSGFSVRDCTFGNNRSRGILIKASNGEISGNRVENCHAQGIKIAPEYYWLESGYSRNVKVFGNTVINSGAEALLIEGIRGESGFENIVIDDNTFRTECVPGVSIDEKGCVILPGNTLNGVELKQQGVIR